MITYKIFTLPNGIDVLFLKRPEKYSVYVDVIVNAGSLYETADVSGVSHFFEHLFFDGTATYPSEQAIRTRQQTIGLSMNASTSVSRIRVPASFPKSEAKDALQLVKEMIFESLLTDEAIQKERTVILDEQRQRKDRKEVILWEFMLGELFSSDNPLRLSPGGTKESVTGLSPEHIRAFYKRHITPQNTSIIIGGNFTNTEIETLLHCVFLSIPKGNKVAEPQYTNAAIRTGHIASLEQVGDQEYFSFSHPSYAGSDPFENMKQAFVYVLLREELHKRLRIQSGLVYHISVSPFRPTSSVSVTHIDGSCRPDDFPLVAEKILSCISEIKRNGFEPGLFDRIRTVSNKTMPMRFDTLSGALSWCSDDFHLYRKVFLPDEILSIRNSITETDLVEVMKETFTKDALSVVTLGPLPVSEVKQTIEKVNTI